MRRRFVLLALVPVLALFLIILCLSGLPSFSRARLARAADFLSVTGVSPDVVTTTLAHDLTILGTGFVEPFTAEVGPQVLGDAGLVDGATLTATLPVGFPVGTHTVTVTVAGESAALAQALTVQNAPPALSGVTPDGALYGAGPVLTITGAEFVAVPQVFLNNTPCADVALVDTETITAAVPADLLPGVYDVVVRNPGPGMPQDVLEDAFTLTSPTPTITAIEPVAGANDLDLTVVISGTNFVPTLSARLGSVDLVDVVRESDARLTAVVPWGMDAGVYDLAVTNPGPGTPAASLTGAYTVTPGIGVPNPGKLYGGFVDEVGLDPQNPASVYAVIGHLGLYASPDGGESWSFKRSLVFANNLVVDPLVEDRLYLYGDWSLLRSDDGGASWETLEPTFPDQASLPEHCRGTRAYPHPTNPNVLYVGTCGHNMEGTGLVKSTDDGATWAAVMDGLTDPFVTALAFHPDDPNVMAAGTINGKVFLSTNGGGSWTEVGQPLAIISELVFNPFGSQELWAASGAFDAAYSFPPARSTNATYTDWESVGITDPQEGVYTVAFSPVTAGTVYVIGNNAMRVSTDHGTTWTAFDPALDVTFHPGAAGTLYLGTHGGILKTTDGGATWTAANEGLTGMLPSSMTSVPGEPGELYASIHGGAGGASGIWHATRGGEVWRFLPIPDTNCTGPIVVDPTDTDRLWVAGLSEVCTSEDGGETWQTKTLTLPAAYKDCEGILPHAFRGNRAQPGTLLYGGRVSCGDNVSDPGFIFVSRDAGATWQAATIHDTGATRIVQDFAFDAVDANVAYAATQGSGLLKSTDGGVTWGPIGRTVEGLDDVISLAATSHAPHTVFAGGRGGDMNTSNFFSSDDQGVTWFEFPPDEMLVGGTGVNLHQILVTPDPSSTLYAATPNGLRKSTDGGTTWTAAAGALGHVSVGSLAISVTDDRVILYVGTTGGQVPGAASSGMLSAAATAGELVEPGLYRFTTVPTTDQFVFLPLVMRP